MKPQQQVSGQVSRLRQLPVRRMVLAHGVAGRRVCDQTDALRVRAVIVERGPIGAPAVTQDRAIVMVAR